MGCAGQNADTTAHSNAVHPTDNWLGVGVDQIVQFVFFCKEGLTGVGTTATLGLGHASIERNNIATGTKCLVAFSFDPDSANPVVASPAFELCLQHPNHLKRESV